MCVTYGRSRRRPGFKLSYIIRRRAAYAPCARHEAQTDPVRVAVCVVCWSDRSEDLRSVLEQVPLVDRVAHCEFPVEVLTVALLCVPRVTARDSRVGKIKVSAVHVHVHAQKRSLSLIITSAYTATAWIPSNGSLQKIWYKKTVHCQQLNHIIFIDAVFGIHLRTVL